MSKAAKRGKSAQGGAAGAKWEQGLLAAQFEEVSFFQFYFSSTFRSLLSEPHGLRTPSHG